MSLNNIKINNDTIVNIDTVYDISEANDGENYINLEDALGTNGQRIPESIRKGGMSVRFIQTNENRYVQYRLKTQLFSTNETDWEIITIKEN